MKRTGPKHKCFATVALVMSLMVVAVPILAQQEELMAGSVAGEQAARASVNGTLWLVVGCFGGIVGLVIAYVFEPSPPATQLLGKSPEYVAAYTVSYKATAKKIQTNKALTGCIVSTVAYVVLVVLSTAAAERTVDY